MLATRRMYPPPPPSCACQTYAPVPLASQVELEHRSETARVVIDERAAKSERGIVDENVRLDLTADGVKAQARCLSCVASCCMGSSRRAVRTRLIRLAASARANSISSPLDAPRHQSPLRSRLVQIAFLMTKYGRKIDDVRVTLDGCFSIDGAALMFDRSATFRSKAFPARARAGCVPGAPSGGSRS
jgi:hypothetical protein